MMIVPRRLISLLMLAAYGLAVFAGIAHLEHHHHHKPVSLPDAGGVATVGLHHGCSCSHHTHSGSVASSCGVDLHEDNGSPVCPHDHGDGDCPICQVLAEKPIPMAIVSVVSAPVFVTDPPDDPVVSPDSPPVLVPVSRGPPVCG